MHGEGRGAVFEVEGFTQHGTRQLPWFPDRHETGPEGQGDGGGEDESPGFHPDHHVNGLGGRRHDGVNRLPETLGRGKKRGDVLENHPGFGPVRNIRNQGGDQVHRL